MSVGLSPWRLLRVPLLLGLLVAFCHAGLRGYIQPVGEQRLDALGSAIAVGNLGMTITAGEFLQPDPATVLRVEEIDAPSGAFVGLFVQRSDEHTSELQSLMLISYAVFCLKKKHTNTHDITVLLLKSMYD